ncbi:mediator of RNA polymerase II transcription subunit 20b, partial [Arabidopsis lyrata subsp. lyrata]|uniref:mediator of RNA polymerase II transcription subunit 20b n=1 Tax=Arabidopsis lyrata subsp. lyrata TaxID=81972 RepID=UPI000A29DD19
RSILVIVLLYRNCYVNLVFYLLWGFSRLLHWRQPNQGSTLSSQILNKVTQSIESLNGVKEGKWKATLNYYKPMLRDQANQAEFPREFLGVSLPKESSKYYFVVRSQRIVVDADSSIQMIMENLESYKCKLSFYFEGFQYQLGDFQVRVGKKKKKRVSLSSTGR